MIIFAIMKRFEDILTSVHSIGFETTALEAFRFQAEFCEPYRLYLELLGVEPTSVMQFSEIPYLPIEIFRTHTLYSVESLCGGVEGAELTFSSSGTSGGDTSTHYVYSEELYKASFMSGFEEFYGDASQYRLLTMLPSYRQGSSLLYMVRELEQHCRGERLLLLGVTFALLEAARSGELGRLPKGSIVIETGGMKGRNYQIEREDLHRELCEAFGVDEIHSEYGMCELLSQAYSKGRGLFRPSSSMRVFGRRLDNPLEMGECGELVGLNIVDLSNWHSCSFLATGDRGYVYEDGSFEVLGRIEGEILRGCNML